MNVINPFENKSEADRYDRYRPRYHHLPLEQIRKLVGRDFESSLDVACGTGHSTVAIARVSKRTVGCDLSEAMLTVARKNTGIHFVQGKAEELPFAAGEFDFVNVAMGFHWLDQEKFLSELNRVLSPGGYFCVDNYGFSGKISEDAAKQQLHSSLFQEYLPSASRRSGYPSAGQLQPFGLELVKEITYKHTLSLNAEEFANLIMTWSNYQVLSDERKTAAAYKMHEVYDTIFGGKSLDLEFGGKAVLFFDRNLRVL